MTESNGSMEQQMSSNPSRHNGPELAQAVRELFAEGQTDYGLEPVVMTNELGNVIGQIQDGDSVVFCCRRGEREIQLTEAFTDPALDKFHREVFKDLYFVILTLFHEKFKDLPVAFAPSRISQTLGEVVSAANLRQLRVTESEKFSHVTFFFNGGNNKPFPGQTNVCIPSLKGIAFDQVPELKLSEITEDVIKGVKSGFDLIVTNFANGDVIGHTQNRAAKIRCAEAVDYHLGKVIDAAIKDRYVVFVTADHGNLEEFFTEDGSPHVSHTSNPVRFLLIDPSAIENPVMRNGILADIAPTILHVMGIEPVNLMTGSSLVEKGDFGGKRRTLLVILDGWGIGENDDTNPIYLAKTPVWDRLCDTASVCELQAAGEAVGLKPEKAGNSEAGHMNIGAGRVVLQDDVRLDLAMKDGSFYTNEIICKAIEQAKERRSNLHLIGLLTEKSSHGSIDYPLAILKMAHAAGLEQVFLHMILDGRSTVPGSAPELLELLDSKMAAIGIGQIVSVIGRGIALDRDGNYNKTKCAYDALVYGTGRNCVKNFVRT